MPLHDDDGGGAELQLRLRPRAHDDACACSTGASCATLCERPSDDRSGCRATPSWWRARDDGDACDAVPRRRPEHDGDELPSLQCAPDADDGVLRRREPCALGAYGASVRGLTSSSGGDVDVLALFWPLAFCLLNLLLQRRRGSRVRTERCDLLLIPSDRFDGCGRTDR